MLPRRVVDSSLDARFLAYATTSWNASQAVATFGQLIRLAPLYVANRREMFGPVAGGEARRTWGLVADLASAITGLAPTPESLIELGISGLETVVTVVPPASDFALAGSPVLKRLDLAPALVGELGIVLAHASAHDAVARPLLGRLHDEVHAYDADARNAAADGAEATLSFGQLLRDLPDRPADFPQWDGRPMFLDEQRGFLDYLAKSIAAEIVSDLLLDEELGEHLLRRSGLLRNSLVAGEPVLEVGAVPARLLERPVALVCHQAGNAALDALAAFDPGAPLLDRLYVVEAAVRAELGIDVAPALAAARALEVERHFAAFETVVVDLREQLGMTSAVSIETYEFPELRNDAA